MSIIQGVNLVLLGAIWGGSALCMKIIVPALGSALTSFGRLLIASVCLAILSPFFKVPLKIRQNWKYYLLIGVLNGSVPYFLFAYAARDLTASVLSVLNAFTPMWGTVLGFMFRLHPITWSSSLGLVIGITGVAILVGFDPQTNIASMCESMAVVVVGTLSYSLAALYSKRSGRLNPVVDAHGSMWGACLCSSVGLFWVHPHEVTWTISVVIALFVLGVVCTGLAAVLFFKLLKELSTPPVLAVSFLVPIFGIFWGVLFLEETVGWNTVLGAGVTVLGTALVTGFIKMPPWRDLRMDIVRWSKSVSLSKK